MENEQRTFLALFLGSASDEGKAEMTGEKSQDLMERWGAWAGAQQSSIVDGGTPLGPTTRVDSSGSSAKRNQIVTYSVVHAASPEAAAEIFAEHPHLSLHPDNSIEIMERLRVPEMGSPNPS
jgi:hypothetical protein